MGLKITRKPKRHSNSGPESVSLQSAYYDHLRLANNDDALVATTQVADFADKDGCLDQVSAKRLFDHIWSLTEKDKRSNILLDLTGISDAVPSFRTELTYLSGQLRRQCRFVRLSSVELEGDWEDWL